MNSGNSLLLSILFFVGGCKQPAPVSQTLKDGSQFKLATDTLPYQNLNGNNWLIVECQVNGNKARLIIDNGTRDGLYLDKQFALESQLIRKDSASRDVIRLKDVEISAGAIKDRVSLCTLFDLRSVTGNAVDGLLGITFLENYFLEVNYIKSYVIFHKPGSFKTLEKWVSLKMKRASKGTGRLVNMEVYLPNGRKIVETAKLDLGLGGTPLFFPGSIVRKYHLDSLKKGTELKDLGRFVTKEKVKGYVYELDSVRLNNVLFEAVSSEFTVSKQGISGDGHILFGNGLLKTLGTVVFDFKSDVLYFHYNGK